MHVSRSTVVWKIFVWNYFVVENVRENNFRSLVTNTHENILTIAGLL